MKVLAFLNSYSQGLSGGDACFLNNVKYLGKKAKVTIVTSLLGKELCQREGIHAGFYITSKEKNFSSVILTYIQRTLKALFLKPPSEKTVLYSSSDFFPDVFPAFLFKLINRKHIWIQKVFHLIPKERKIPYLFQQISFLLIKSADLIIVDNSKLKKDLEVQYNFLPEKITVISPGVDVSYLKKIKPNVKKYDAIFIGQLRESKGIFNIPDIWENVVKKYPDAHLAVIGKNIGDNQTHLKKELIKKYLTKNVDILGFLETQKKLSLLKSAKCLILPSYEEGFGMVILESLVCGTPIIAYDLPVFHEHFSGGISVVKIGDTLSFSRKAINIIKTDRREDHCEIYNNYDLNNLVKKEYQLINNYYEKKSFS